MTLAPDVIVCHTTAVVRALRHATSSIPIVVAAVNDPVEQGFVSSLAHPGGNITGFTFIDFQMVGKWLEILTEAAPSISHAALMFNPDSLVSQQSSGREWQKSWKMRMSSSAVNAAAPNFVHSLDASHAVRVINAAVSEGLPTLRRFMIASPVWLRKFNNFISS